MDWNQSVPVADPSGILLNSCLVLSWSTNLARRHYVHKKLMSPKYPLDSSASIYSYYLVAANVLDSDAYHHDLFFIIVLTRVELFPLPILYRK